MSKSIEREMQKVGGKAQLINAASTHYRLTGPLGGEIDYYERRGKWHVHRRTSISGVGLASASALLATLEPTGESTRSRPEHRAPRAPDVTIFADGSFHHASKAAGWGGWIRRDDETATSGGPLEDVETSQEAEMRALAHMLNEGAEHGWIEQGDLVLLQSDCSEVLATLMKMAPGTVCHHGPGSIPISPAKRLSRTLRESAGLESILAKVSHYRLRLVVRHVRGHQPVDNARAWINHKVDRLARQHMMRQREAAR